MKVCLPARSSARSLRAFALLAGTACCMPAVAQGPFVQADVIDLSGITIVGTDRQDIPMTITDAGDIFGFSVAGFELNGNNLGTFTSWRANSAGAIRLGLTGPQYVEPTTGASISSMRASNSAGQAVGDQARGSLDNDIFFNGDADQWFFDGSTFRTIGLNASILNTVAPFREQNFVADLNESGVAVGGYSALVPVDPDVFPFAAFIVNGWYSRDGVTAPLGLTGDGFIDSRTGKRFSQVTGINDQNKIIGYSSTFRPEGSRLSEIAWIFDLETSSYQQMGLTGEAFTFGEEGISRTVPSLIGEDGTVVGITTAATGSKVPGTWMFQNGVTTQIGLIGERFGLASEGNTSSLAALNNTGMAIGRTRIDTGVQNFDEPAVFAQAAWVAVNGVTRRLGPTTSEFVTAAGLEQGDVVALNDAGLIIGTSSVYTSDGRLQGAQRTWVQRANSDNVRFVGLTDALHTGPNGEQQTIAELINDEGFVAGVSFKFVAPRINDDNVDYTPWLYDSNTDTFTVVPLPAANDGSTSGFVLGVTSRGGVVGFYRESINAAIDEVYRPYYWSARAGFVNLLPTGPGYPSPLLVSYPIAVSPDGTRVAVGGTLLTGDPNLLRVVTNDGGSSGCDSIDFNRNELFPEDQDLVDFLGVLAGGACPSQPCDVDFNNDGLFPDDQDLIAFLRVLAGGNC